MARSLGFAAYRALSRRRSRPSPAISRPRPEGEVLWLHATSAGRFAALRQLGLRIKSLREDLVVLITRVQEGDGSDPGVAPDETSGMCTDIFTSDHPADARQFLDHWRPDICLWAGAILMPNLINQAMNDRVPMVLVDVSRDDFPSRRRKWFPDLTRSSLGQFDTILSNSQPASDMLRRTGVPADRIELCEPLRAAATPPPMPEVDISDTSRQLTGRPLWLAAHVHPDEFAPVVAAHRAALRLVHRLLLVMTVDDPRSLDRLTGVLRATGLRFAHWQVGDDIDDNTQVLISDGTDDLGLWYRMAPLTFMASSLTAGNTGCDPLEAVALGSAILFGPHVPDHRGAYARLTAAGAARTVGDAEGLGAAVIRLMAPDHAAAMALAGWQVVTEGAVLTDRLVDMVMDRLDSRETGHARP